MADLPVSLPLAKEAIVCSIAAANHYKIPANLMLAVAEQEGGKPWQVVRNSNGTADIGPMQINSAYLRQLNAKYGITAEDVAAPGCYPYFLAAWRIRGHLSSGRSSGQGDIWSWAANYNSVTPEINARYRSQLIVRASKWMGWLQNNYKIIAVL